MTRKPPIRDATPTDEPTTGGLLVAILLLLTAPLALWAASEPVLAAALVAITVGVAYGLPGVVDALAGARRGGRRRLCVPHTGVCVEI